MLVAVGIKIEMTDGADMVNRGDTASLMLFSPLDVSDWPQSHTLLGRHNQGGLCLQTQKRVRFVQVAHLAFSVSSLLVLQHTGLSFKL